MLNIYRSASEYAKYFAVVTFFSLIPLTLVGLSDAPVSSDRVWSFNRISIMVFAIGYFIVSMVLFVNLKRTNSVDKIVKILALSWLLGPLFLGLIFFVFWLMFTGPQIIQGIF